MTDQIPADKVRKIASEMRDAMRREDDGYLYADFLADMGDYIRDLESLLPAPSRPTLADMTEEERAACIRMQCDTAPNRSVRGFIADVYPGGCRVIERDTWAWRSCSDDLVTPRPDLPRMEWPGDTPNTGPKVTFSLPAPTAPAPSLPGDWRLADHYRIGRVIVTNPTPNQGGHVYFVTSDDCVPRGSGWGFCTPDELTYLDTDQKDDQ